MDDDQKPDPRAQAQAEKAARQAYAEKTEKLAAIIKPLRSAAYEVDMDWRWFHKHLTEMGNDYGGLEFNPDFQRGHVWTPEQQTHFIENILRGVVSSSGFLIQFNCPNWDNHDYKGELPRGFQCIDGLQRITAVMKFLNGEIKPFGLHVDDLDGSSFSIRSKYRFRVAIHNFERKFDLLSHYLDINAGGTPHSASELERVRAMRAASKATASNPADAQGADGDQAADASDNDIKATKKSRKLSP